MDRNCGDYFKFDTEPNSYRCWDTPDKPYFFPRSKKMTPYGRSIFEGIIYTILSVLLIVLLTALFLIVGSATGRIQFNG